MLTHSELGMQFRLVKLQKNYLLSNYIITLYYLVINWNWFCFFCRICSMIQISKILHKLRLTHAIVKIVLNMRRGFEPKPEPWLLIWFKKTNKLFLGPRENIILAVKTWTEKKRKYQMLLLWPPKLKSSRSKNKFTGEC